MQLKNSHVQFLSFALVGVAGLCVDIVALFVARYALGLGPYAARVFSYLCAATCTWTLNRNFTFRDRRDPRWLREWAKFLTANIGGGLVNYGVYAISLLGTANPGAVRLAFAVCAGSIAGLALNFTLSRRAVFTGGKQPS